MDRIRNYEVRLRWKPRGRPRKRFMDSVKEDMKFIGVSKEDAGDRVR